MYIYISNATTNIFSAVNEEEALHCIEKAANVRLEDATTYSDQEEGTHGTMHEVQNATETYYCCDARDTAELASWIEYLQR